MRKTFPVCTGVAPAIPENTYLKSKGVSVGFSDVTENMGMICLHLSFTIPRSSRADLIDLLRAAIPTYESPGGIRVRLLEHMDDPTRFIEVIEYADDTAFSSDQLRVETDEQMIRFISQWRALLDVGPEINGYRDVTEEVKGHAQER